jgi:hypothetical protein
MRFLTMTHPNEERICDATEMYLRLRDSQTDMSI